MLGEDWEGEAGVVRSWTMIGKEKKGRKADGVGERMEADLPCS
jgi:hypothetical protein